MSSRLPCLMLPAALAAAFVAWPWVAGCSEKYAHQRLGPSSPQGQQVAAMAAQLRAAQGSQLAAVIAAQSAPGLTGPQQGALTASLLEIASAEKVELTDLDAFGPDVYRATMELTAGQNVRTAAMLLVKTPSGLRWAGRN